ncbi:MAG: D-glycerate dehydrogenase [Candidatus Bipolaricaulota bacterium]|nr:MAG: D-glycerate dehydrogenase [Candidatus Bipolaricaulota bacterium]
MAKVVRTTFLFDDQLLRLSSAGHEISPAFVEGHISRDELLRQLPDAEALICLLTDVIDGPLLDRAPRLRVVANVAVGYENIDLRAARARGIMVTNTPDVLTEATADLTLALLLATARRVVEGDGAVRAGAFPAWGLCQPLLGTDVHRCTLGIVGLGRIGTAVARRAALGFGMTVLYAGRMRNTLAEDDLGVEFAPLDRLLRESDIVTLHVPLTEETRHMIDRDALRTMKPTALLINVARGAIVDEAALVDALQKGDIAGAGIDVFEREPKVHEGLRALHERVVLTPHLGSATEATRRAMARLAVDNVLAVLSGDPPPSPVG